MARFFHATSIENVQSIREKGLITKYGEVYLTDSLDSACRWVGFRLKAMGQDIMAVIEVEADETKLIEGCDHSPMMVQLFGVADFEGEHIHFGTDKFPTWKEVLNYLIR